MPSQWIKGQNNCGLNDVNRTLKFIKNNWCTIERGKANRQWLYGIMKKKRKLKELLSWAE